MGGGNGPQIHIGIRTPKTTTHPEWGVQDDGSGESYRSHDSDEEKPKVRKRHQFRFQSLDRHIRSVRSSVGRPRGALMMIFAVFIFGSMFVAFNWYIKHNSR